MKPISFIAGNKSRLLLLAAVATGVLGMQAGRGTMAFFTTQATATSSTFTAGNLVFNVNKAGEATNPQSSVSTAITFTGAMQPGDTVYAPIQITNLGNLDSVYGMSYFTSFTAAGGGQDFAPWLDLAIVGTGNTGGDLPVTAGDGTKDAAAGTGCNATRFAAAIAAAGLDSHWPEVIQTTTPMSTGGLVGAPINVHTLGTATTLAAPAGIRIPPLGTDILCMQITFDEGASQNARNSLTPHDTTVTFTFNGLANFPTPRIQ